MSFSADRFDELVTLTGLNDDTRLCMLPETKKLYIVKRMPHEQEMTMCAAALISNLHLCRVYCVLPREDCVETVFEYVCGDTLASMLDRGVLFSDQAAIRILSDICDGLSALHGIGIVHRDINPNNVIISKEGHATVIDFGIARSFDLPKSADTVIMGTPGYAAPEQFGFRQSNSQTDVYAAGVLLNVMLTGKMPFEEMAGGDLGRIVRKCVSMDPADRYPSAEKLKEALDGKTSERRVVRGVIQKIPGIRSTKPWVVILSLLIYAAVGLYVAAIMLSGFKNGTWFVDLIAMIFQVVIPFFCFTNSAHVWEKTQFASGSDKKTKRGGFIFLGIMSIIVGLMIFGFTV